MNHVLDNGNVQVASSSDPEGSSAGTVQFAHPPPPAGPPMDYPVASYGADPDMEGTMHSVDIAQ
jgi:hypothetical protein